MKKICIIPARMGSSRFPGKPLKEIMGIPMIIHIAKRCALSKHIDAVMVATCDDEIKQACIDNGIAVIMTSNTHERCTDRVSEAIEKVDFSLDEDDFILMVQGDEILVTPDMLGDVVNAYVTTKEPVINLLSKIYKDEDYKDPNVVKVVITPDNYALYFSRAPIPSDYREKNMCIYQQMGIIGFSKAFLKKFSLLDQTPLEKIESIDMLRVLENRLPLKVVCTDKETIAVDVPYDLKRARIILKTDPFTKKYV